MCAKPNSFQYISIWLSIHFWQHLWSSKSRWCPFKLHDVCWRLGSLIHHRWRFTVLVDKLLTYTRRWNLNVNIDKTKVIIFNKGGHIIKRFNFWLGTEPVSITQQYCYLGIIFRHLVLSIVQSLTSPIKPWKLSSDWNSWTQETMPSSPSNSLTP